MTAIGSINAGARILASAMQGIAPQAVIKGADQTLFSSTTLQNDSALLTTLIANASYLFACYLDFEGASGAGLKWGWTVPSGCTMRYLAAYLNTSAAVTLAGETQASTPAADTTGSGNLQGLLMIGSVLAGSAGGTLQLQWAQNSSNAANNIVHAQSFLSLWRIS